jgi:hypothetical protein
MSGDDHAACTLLDVLGLRDASPDNPAFLVRVLRHRRGDVRRRAGGHAARCTTL